MAKSYLSCRPRWWWRSFNNSRVSSSDMSNWVASHSLAFPIANGIRIFYRAGINHSPNSSSSGDSIKAPYSPRETSTFSGYLTIRSILFTCELELRSDLPQNWQRAGLPAVEWNRRTRGIPLFYEVIVLLPTSPPFSARSNCTNWHEFFSWFTCSLDVQFFYTLIREQRSWLVTTNRGSIHPLPLFNCCWHRRAVSFFC